MTAQAATPTASTSAGRFGTFAGVFTPNVLTILGIILFLRMGWVVGQAGLWGALAIVLLANTISLLTGLSLSAIATNMQVGAGGNYYLISRSLGLEIGGAIGIPLFLSQAISVAFYIIGFTEALLAVEFFAQFDPRIISTGVALLFCVIAYVGADFALKIQYGILAILIVALLSFFTGWGSSGLVEPNLTPSFTEGVNFWIVFAVFFPAVTGIEVGTSLSGDLKDPSRSIPLGTIASILVTAVIYFLVVIWFAFNSTTEQLINDNLAMQRIAILPQAILAGVWASTLSSALGSVLAAPRTLQAIARDNVVPSWIASQMGSKTEPRMAVLITGAIAIAVIWMGNLNFVAPVISMFFLNTYGMVNLAAAIEKLVGNPSYRPRFKIPWYVSLLGALGCYGAMFLINPIATLVAIIASYGVFFVLQSQELEKAWGDVRSGIWFALVRFCLIQLESSPIHTKNWRPNIMVFTGQPHNRQQLVEMSKWLSLGRGIVTFFQLIISDVDDQHDYHLIDRARKHIRKHIEDNDMTAFAEAEIVTSFNDGVLMLVQAHGLGRVQANAVLMGWSRTTEGHNNQMHLMHDMIRLKKSVLFLNFDPVREFGNRHRINIWWQGRGGNEDLMLLLAHFITQHRDWQGAQVQMLRIIDTEEAHDSVQAHMQSVIDAARIDAKPIVIVAPKNQRIAATITEYSQGIDLTILGMHLPDEDEIALYCARLQNLVQAVGTVLLVRNAELDDDLLLTD
jgi:amino acid transporter